MEFTMDEVQTMIGLIGAHGDKFGIQSNKDVRDIILKCKSHCTYKSGDTIYEMNIHVPEFQVV